MGGALQPSSTSEHREDAHGRREVRRCRAFAAVTRLYKAEQWPALRSLAIIQRERTVGTKTTCERRHHIGSLPAEAARIAHAVRGHREIANRVHGRLDIQFNKGQSSACTGFAANDLAIARHIVINLLRLNTSRKGSTKTKRMQAATSDRLRAELLGFLSCRCGHPGLTPGRLERCMATQNGSSGLTDPGVSSPIPSGSSQHLS